MYIRVLFFITIIVLLFGRNNSELIETKTLIQRWENSVKSSRLSERDDQRLLSNWSDDYQVRRLSISVKYRLQMIKHEEHNFKTDGNQKWVSCLHVHSNEIKNTKEFYYENELQCIKTCFSKHVEKIKNVEQLEKELIKWRRGYRYLKNLCNVENPRNQNKSQECLIKYMQNDNYDQVIERLMVLKLSAMSDLYANYKSSLLDLEECLRSLLSRYVDKIRFLMDILHKCYNISSL